MDVQEHSFYAFRQCVASDPFFPCLPLDLYSILLKGAKVKRRTEIQLENLYPVLLHSGKPYLPSGNVSDIYTPIFYLLYLLGLDTSKRIQISRGGIYGLGGGRTKGQNNLFSKQVESGGPAKKLHFLYVFKIRKNYLHVF